MGVETSLRAQDGAERCGGGDRPGAQAGTGPSGSATQALIPGMGKGPCPVRCTVTLVSRIEAEDLPP